MKRCPQCNRTYDDDALSFCLDDGSPLVSTSAPSSFDPSATVQYPQSRETSPPPTIAYPGPTPSLTPPPPPRRPGRRCQWRNRRGGLPGRGSSELAPSWYFWE